MTTPVVIKHRKPNNKAESTYSQRLGNAVILHLISGDWIEKTSHCECADSNTEDPQCIRSGLSPLTFLFFFLFSYSPKTV